MKPKTYFKINSIEELEQAYKKYKEQWDERWPLEIDKGYFKKMHYRIIECDENNKVGLYSFPTDEYTEVPNPFTEVDCEEVKPEFPCEMLVWDDDKKLAENATIYGIFQGQYLGKDYDGCFMGYKHAKPIKKDVSEWTADDIQTKEDAEKWLKYLIDKNELTQEATKAI